MSMSDTKQKLNFLLDNLELADYFGSRDVDRVYGAVYKKLIQNGVLVNNLRFTQGKNVLPFEIDKTESIKDNITRIKTYLLSKVDNSERRLREWTAFHTIYSWRYIKVSNLSRLKNGKVKIKGNFDAANDLIEILGYIQSDEIPKDLGFSYGVLDYARKQNVPLDTHAVDVIHFTVSYKRGSFEITGMDDAQVQQLKDILSNNEIQMMR